MAIIKLPTGTFEYDTAKPLGKPGGFGAVFLGKTESGDEVAVKKLHVTARSAAHRELTIAEELKQRTFQHVLPFIDSGEDADSGDYFLVMPRAERSLQTHLDVHGSESPQDAAGILLEIVKGLTEVGDLVHRDLKPDNILFHDNGWKIADFGIARFIEDVTASNTLKNCLSPYYASPEQWRMERATHASDIYSLGCIAFCLLTGKPPFRREPEEQHQHDPVPSFACDDARLKSVILLMLRKAAPTRPSLNRVQELLEAICSNPPPNIPAGGFSSLAAAGATVADEEQQRQAKENAKTVARLARNRLAGAAVEILQDGLERLWGNIQSNAAAAERTSGGGGLGVTLGQGQLIITFDREAVPDGAFAECQWDVLASGRLTVAQRNKFYAWSTSLWYARLPGEHDYRWCEVGYYYGFSGGTLFEPFSLPPGRDADLAAASAMHSILLAIGPWKCDGESEAEFHERVAWLLDQAANAQLGHPRSLPITSWPPSMIVGYP